MTQPPRRAVRARPEDGASPATARPARAFADDRAAGAEHPAPRRGLPPDPEPTAPSRVADPTPSRPPAHALGVAGAAPGTVAPVLPPIAPDRLAPASRRKPASDQANPWTPRATGGATAAPRVTHAPAAPPKPGSNPAELSGAAPTAPAEPSAPTFAAAAAQIAALPAEPVTDLTSRPRPAASGAPRHGDQVTPRRGIGPKPRPRRGLPLGIAALVAGVASVALVLTSIQAPRSGGTGLAPASATPTQIAAIESAAATPTGIKSTYAAGAFAAPETGGVRLTSSATGPLSGKVIVLDPGHNGGFKSAINNRNYYTFGAGWRPCAAVGTTTTGGITEHTIVWQLANTMVGLLLAQGATVVLTRADDTGYGPCNNERPEIANREGASLFLSLHVDGNDNTSLRGFHLTYSTRMAGGNDVSQSSAKAADIVMQHLLGGTKLPASNYMQTNGVSIIARTDLAVLDGIRGAPALLLETGNSRNPDDVAILTSDAGQASVAQALTAAAVEIVRTLPANTTAGAASPSPEAPAGASVPPTNATPAWETPTASSGNDEAGAEYTPTASPSGTR